MAHGIVGHIGIGKESTWGTAVAASDYMEALSESVVLTPDRFDVKNIVGRFSEPDDMAGVNRIEGDIVFPGDPTILGIFLMGASGNNSGSVVLSGFLWNNAFNLASSDAGTNNPFPSYTLEIFRDVTSSFRYSGIQISRLELNAAINQDLRATATIIGKTASVIAKTSPSFVNSPASPFAFDTASISIGGAGNAEIEALTVSIDNQLEGVPVLNSSLDIAKVRRRGPQLVRMSGTLGFENLTEYNAFTTKAERRIFVNFFRASSFNLLIDIPRFVYSTFPVGIGGRERLTVGFEGICRYHSGSGTAIQTTLTTTKSDY